MAKHSRSAAQKHPKIAAIETTADNLTSRAGLALFGRYLDNIGLTWFIDRWLGPVRKSNKGQSATECLCQILLFFIDGSSRHLSYFDSLKEDAGYAATIERDPGDLLSSHAVKRFFGNFTQGRIWLLRKLLQEIFIWRLCLEKPEVVILDLDVMILDNDESLKREGVTPTYKKVKGFAPLQMVYGRIIIDAVFRAGHHHSNHKKSTAEMVKHIVHLVRKRYRAEVPIIIRQDSGYFDQKLFGLYEELGIGYLSGGKLYKEIKEYVAQWPADRWSTHRNDHQEWSYVEFGDRRKDWKRFRRVIYCRPAYEDRQLAGVRAAGHPDLHQPGLRRGCRPHAERSRIGRPPVAFGPDRLLPWPRSRRVGSSRLEGLHRRAASVQTVPAESRLLLHGLDRLRVVRELQVRCHRPGGGHHRLPEHPAAVVDRRGRQDRHPQRSGGPEGDRCCDETPSVR